MWLSAVPLWLENIHDWCISRQLWWGHRIPAWYVALEDDELKKLGSYDDHWIVARDEKDAQAEASKRFAGKKFELCQDPDVLDTWFSSGLFPLSVLGWPDETDDLKAFYPTSVLETGHDILFFWVARMVMLGIKLGGDVPFRKVYLHPMIRDAHGRLHKRLEEGNLDPNELAVAKAGQMKDFPNGIAECGADALDLHLFLTQLSCQWILSVLNKAISRTVASLDSYDFSDGASTVYSWWQYQFCDVFIEAIKPYFAGDDPAIASERSSAQHALWVCLETGLRLLHPFMPFVTEELWQRLPAVKGSTRKESIMLSEYPSSVECWTNERAENEMDLVESTVKCLRSLRAEVLGKSKNERLPAFAFCQTDAVGEIIWSHEFEILTLASLSSLKVLLSGKDEAPAGCAIQNVNENLIVYLKVQGTLDAEAEQEKIKNKMAEIQKQQEKLKKIMNAAGYQEKVPSHIQEDNAAKLAKLLQEFEFFQKESTRLDEMK
ncbi:hypothetical protein JRO89_XS10G0113500 [Xanthoceras sorbifolium]|uniref:valine--tRNA ligase n=1 Tax=Xanthoceras sorbifolium TaxID=99658 RepID=A0ABQ8HIB4_9ROSI|nr:hypothetical protein JRO89_XS10G0113500 [Xanthoceras sorbifolium]